MIALTDITIAGSSGDSGQDCLVIRDERILYAGAWQSCPRAIRNHLATDAGPTISLQNGTATPALIDAHTHVTQFHLPGAGFSNSEIDAAILHALRVMSKCAASGITCVRDAGALDLNFLLQPLVARRTDLPDFRHPGAHIAPEGEFGKDVTIQVANAREAERAAAGELDRGANFIKVVAGNDASTGPDDGGSQLLDDDMLTAAVRVAASNGTYVAAHACGWAGVEACIRNGVRSIEHGSGLSRLQAREMAAQGIMLVPTASSFRQFAHEGTVKWNKSPAAVAMFQQFYPPLTSSLQTAIEEGVAISAGTDTLGTLAEELALFAGLGMSPEAALEAATVAPATFFQGDQPRGRLAQDCLADLVIWPRNPLGDFTVLDHEPLLVMRKGEIIHC